MKKVILLAILVFFSSSQQAYAGCDFSKLPFGKGIKEVSKQYNMTLDRIVPIKNGKSHIIVFAEFFCKDLPATARISIEFINDKMSKLIIIDNKSNGYLHKFITDAFGDADNKMNAKKQKNGNIQSTWSNDLVSVRHSINGTKEYMQIDSVVFKDEYNKVIKKSGK